MVKTRFRAKAPLRLQTDAPPAAATTLQTLRKRCSVCPRYCREMGDNANTLCQAAVAASIDRADNSKFLEQFRYTIIASYLLSGTSIVGHRPAAPSIPNVSQNPDKHQLILSTEGTLASVFGAFAVAIILSWVLGSAPTFVTRKRLALLLILVIATAFLGQVYVRRSWLRYRREQSLAQIAMFVTNSNDFDSASEATLSLIQEVELVSRGYRM